MAINSLLAWVGFIGLIVGLWYGNRYMQIYLNKKKLERQSGSDIPPEIYEDFEKAELMLKEAKGEITPYEIMLSIAQGKNKLKGGSENERRKETGNEGRSSGIERRPEDSPGVVSGEPTTESSSSQGSIEGRSDIPVDSSRTAERTDESNREPSTKDSGNIFSRLLRKRKS